MFQLYLAAQSSEIESKEEEKENGLLEEEDEEESKGKKTNRVKINLAKHDQSLSELEAILKQGERLVI